MNTDIECQGCKEIFKKIDTIEGLCRKCWNKITEDRYNEISNTITTS